MTDRQKLADRVMDLCQQPNWLTPRSVGLIKLILSSLWNRLSLYDREKFMACIDETLTFVPPEKTPQAMQDEAELARILRDWGQVLDGLTGKEAAFASDVAARRKWRGWRPTPGQEAWIRRIWADRHAPADMDVLE